MVVVELLPHLLRRHIQKITEDGIGEEGWFAIIPCATHLARAHFLDVIIKLGDRPSDMSRLATLGRTAEAP